MAVSDLEAAPERARTSIDIWIRLLTIPLGILSAVLIARDGFRIPLNEYFDAVLSFYDDALTVVVLFLFEPAVHAVLAKLREWFDWHLQLYQHWKHVFALTWMCFGALGRYVARLQRQAAFHLGWAGLSALVSGALAGTATLGSYGLFLGTIFGFLLHGFGTAIWWGVKRGYRNTFRFGYQEFQWQWREWLIEFVPFAAISFTAGQFLITSPSPGLVSTATLAAIYACWNLWTAFWLLPVAIWRSGLESPEARVGLDILYVLGGAAFIVWLGHALA